MSRTGKRDRFGRCAIVAKVRCEFIVYGERILENTARSGVETNEINTRSQCPYVFGRSDFESGNGNFGISACNYGSAGGYSWDWFAQSLEKSSPRRSSSRLTKDSSWLWFPLIMSSISKD